jgi:hypothetical protein
MINAILNPRSRMLLSLTLTAAFMISAARAHATEPQNAEAAPRLTVLLRSAATNDTAALRKTTEFVSFVADSAGADVLVDVTLRDDQRYALYFHGGRILPTRTDTLVTATAADTSTSEFVRTVGSTLKLGLLPYVAKLPVAAGLEVSLAQDFGRIAPAQTDDRWNRWIFNVGVKGSIAAQQLTSTHDLGYQAGANRTTETARLEFAYSLTRSGSRYDIGETRLRSTTRSDTVAGLFVRRLSAHWGAGLRGNTSSSTLLNQKRVIAVTPALEYSVFPYEDFARRQLTVQYALGVDRFEYFEETIYEKMDETLPKQMLSLTFNANKSWGLVNASLVGSQYLNDMSKRRLSSSVGVNLMLFHGLSLISRASYTLIRDQIFLAKGDGTIEDVLLKRRQLETGYQYSTAFGLMYSFGSKAPGASNPRLR